MVIRYALAFLVYGTAKNGVRKFITGCGNLGTSVYESVRMACSMN